MSFRFFASNRERRAVDVSVVIPVYNHAAYLEAAVTSVLEQSVDVREVICIDDGSTDASFAVATELAARDARVKTWTRPNRGANRTLNEGLEAAKGAYVAILNSDDAFEPERLERCIEVLDADPATSLVCTALSFVDAKGARTKSRWYDEAIAFHRKSGDLAASLAYGNFVMTTSNFVARASLFTDVGGFRDLRYAHDLEYLLRILALGHRMTILDAKLLRYRFHTTNTISESGKAVRIEIAAVVASYLRRRIRDPERPASLSEIARMTAACKPHEIGALVTYFLGSSTPEGADPLDAASLLVGADLERFHRELVG